MLKDFKSEYCSVRAPFYSPPCIKISQSIVLLNRIHLDRRVLKQNKSKLKQQNYEKIAILYLIVIDKKAGLEIKVSLLGVVAL